MKWIYLAVLIGLLTLVTGCTSHAPVEGVVVDKYMIDPGYQAYYPSYYVVYKDDTGHNNVRQVSADAYANAEKGVRYKWSTI